MALDAAAAGKFFLLCIVYFILIGMIGTKTMIMSETTLKKDWENKYDERWNKSTDVPSVSF